MKTKNIVWLASYPKSGNTWTRIFLANYLLNTAEPVPINQVHRIGLGDAVPRLYRMVGGPSFRLDDPRAAVALRTKVLRGIVANGAGINFVKTHNTREPVFGQALIPPEYTRSAVYILRHPCDLAVSYARHYAMTPEATAEAIGRPDNVIAGGSDSVTQFLGRWSSHVTGWTQPGPFPVLTLRYEDLETDPETHFTRLLEFLGIPLDAERLARAIRHASFDEVSAQETKSGFVERPANNARFFHTGRSGQWREALPAAAAERIHRDHATVMARYGYV